MAGLRQSSGGGGSTRWGGRFRLAFLFYNLLLHVSFALLWLPALALREFRGRFFKRLGFRIPRVNKSVWLHAPSVGEALAVRSFVEEFRRVFPGYEIVLTTFTSGGRQVAKQVAADHHLALPFDLYPSVAATVRNLKPALVLLVEGDYWPNLLFVLARRGVPVGVVNGRFTARSLGGYRRARWLFGPLFRNLKFVCAAEEEYRGRYEAMGVDEGNVAVTGNLKYDNYETAARPDVAALIAEALGNPRRDDVLVAASTHAGEEEMVSDVYLRLREERENLKLFVAPRYPARAGEVAALLARKGIDAARRTQLPAGGPADAVVLDTLGELGGLYPLGAVAIIGGSFVPRGGQNMMEAAYHGCVTLWGPHVENFPLETARLAGRGGVRVRDEAELMKALKDIYANAQVRGVLGDEAAAVAREMMGASKRSIAVIRRYLEGSQS
ncbi:MAG TPA: glycosyltransferase N-terminal domain-containing protein [bacterium]|nr:glycosyltransferase N-terminal domain-containing protein [bacterium]